MIVQKYTIAIGTGFPQKDTKALEDWWMAFSRVFDKYGINTEKSIAAFLSNVGVETGGLVHLEENMNYSAKRLSVVWPARYADKSGQPNELAKKIAGNPTAIANHTYASRMGNGDSSSGDGFKYRGRGLIHLTGRANYQAYKQDSGVDVINSPDLLTTIDIATDSAAWFFAKRGCIAAANTGDFSRVVKIINGAYPTAANQGMLRQTRYNSALDALNSKIRVS